MRRFFALLGCATGFSAILLLSGCGQGSVPDETSSTTTDEDLLPAALDRILSHAVEATPADDPSHIYNITYRVTSPTHGIDYSGAAGVARGDSSAPMTPEHQYFIGSIAKTMTATVMLQLWEEGALGAKGLDATLEDLQVFDGATLDRLHVLDGQPHGRTITIEQLLAHRSGLRDGLFDDAMGLSEDNVPMPGSIAGLWAGDLGSHMACLETPGCDVSTLRTTKSWKHWDPAAAPDDAGAGLMNHYLATGMGDAPLFEPGGDFHYTDTGYWILGLAIEKLTGKSLHRNFRDRIFDPLEMAHTYEAYATDPPAGQWEEDVSDFYLASIPAFSAGMNVSFDWAAGGVVTTVSDLERFMRALATGELFEKPETLTAMVPAPGEAHGLGTIGYDVDGRIFWGHGGGWGTIMLYEPQHDTVYVGTVNQVYGDLRGVTIDILDTVDQHRSK